MQTVLVEVARATCFDHNGDPRFEVLPEVRMVAPSPDVLVRRDSVSLYTMDVLTDEGRQWIEEHAEDSPFLGSVDVPASAIEHLIEGMAEAGLHVSH